MKIMHGKNYDAWIREDKNDIASASFYCKQTIEDGTYECEERNGSDMFLVIGLDIKKYRDINSGSLDFEEEYARTVSQMVYEMLLQQ